MYHICRPLLGALGVLRADARPPGGVDFLTEGTARSQKKDRILSLARCLCQISESTGSLIRHVMMMCCLVRARRRPPP